MTEHDETRAELNQGHADTAARMLWAAADPEPEHDPHDYLADLGEERQGEHIADAFADLLHLCKRLGLDGADLIRQGTTSFEEEAEEEADDLARAAAQPD
jgi:hypothetical protein